MPGRITRLVRSERDGRESGLAVGHDALWGLTVRSVGVCALAQQLVQLTALVLRERREYLLLDVVDHVVERSQLLAPGGGDRDDVATPVAGVDRAFDQSASLQLAQHGNDVAAVDARAAPEGRLADWAPFLDRGEHTGVVTAKPGAAGRETVVQQPVCAAVGAADQPGRPVPDPGRGRHMSGPLLGHGAKGSTCRCYQHILCW